MNDAWPALCTLLALVLLLVFIIRYEMNAFFALLLVSLGLGIAAGMPPDRVVETIGRGVGEIMGGVAVILALGAILGRMLDASGAAEVIARTLLRWFRPRRASLAILVAAYVIGIPVLFNVGFLLLIPILYRLQKETGKSLLWFAMPMAFSLATAHSLIPPHPGIVGAVRALAGAASERVMVETILFGTLMGIPVVLVGWYGPGRFWAQRQMVSAPEHLMTSAASETTAPEKAVGAPPPAFALCLLIVTLPLILSVLGFGATLLADGLPAWTREPLVDTVLIEEMAPVVIHSPLTWLQFLGKDTMALLVPTALALWFLGVRRGMSRRQLGKLAGDALTDVGGILFLFGAAGGFKQVIQATGAGDTIARLLLGTGLSAVLVCYLVAVLMRVALGSATASIMAASSLLVNVVVEFTRLHPGHETLLVLAVANGVTFMTQPADSGFWMIKEYCNLSVRDVFLRFNACRVTMSLTGLGLLLAYEMMLH